MNARKNLVATMAAAAFLAAGSAYAGPAVTVTFKNVGASTAAAAVYSKVTANETSTYTNASPKPSTSVEAGNSDTYVVQNPISSDSNYASVRYTIGSKVCVFNTTFVNVPGAGGSKTPTWNTTFTPSGGATCTATKTATNYTNYTWSVQFTMK